VNPRNLPADESERVLGKAIDHEYNLFELLRRPDVRYTALMSMDGGLYASDDVSPEALGDQSAPVIEQVEIAAKYAGYIDRQKGRGPARRALRGPEAAGRPGLYAGDGPVDRGAPEAGPAPAGNARHGSAHFRHHARQRVVVADSPQEGWSKDKGPERLNRLIRV
jgi:hypothetical protein